MMLQRGRAHVSAERARLCQGLFQDLWLQRGRAHVSAERLTNWQAMQGNLRLQRGRAHVRAESTSFNVLMLLTPRFNGAAVTCARRDRGVNGRRRSSICFNGAALT